MALQTERFADDWLDADYLEHLLDTQAHSAAHYGRLWDYFRNPLLPASGPVVAALNSNSRPYMQAQEAGLPARITGVVGATGRHDAIDLHRKEVVIENDIAWRIHTMVDFLFGRQPSIRSQAADSAQAAAINSVIAAVLESNGGVGFFQELALLGSVYGFVDIALRFPALGCGLPAPLPSQPLPDDATSASQAATGPGTPFAPDAAGPARAWSKHDLARALSAARNITLETIEAPRVLPILDDNDYRNVRYWVQRYHTHPPRMASHRRWMGLKRSNSPACCEVIEILSPTWWQRYEDRVLTAEGANLLGRLPVVHVQNVALPGSYEGLSDVEPLVSIQDELNTRLSDRAYRVTYQAFKMYLGKGIDGFLERPIGPGQMWATENPLATVEEFGSDSGSPSEDAHIQQVRDAMDKVSAVPPLAAGLLHGNLGNLTSATALRVLLGGLLARTEKKRLTYGLAIARAIELVLEFLHVEGLLPTRPEDRRVEIHWSSPLPIDEGETLRNAQIKAQLGVPAGRLLAELGYDGTQE